MPELVITKEEDQQDVLSALEQLGPLTGKQLKKRTGFDDLALWRFCTDNPQLYSANAAERYLRLDRLVKGYGRLSPSIKREFLTYQVLGLKDQQEQCDKTVKLLKRQFHEISLEKINLAEERISGLISLNPGLYPLLEKSCFIIAGDVVYNMAHREPRPESSTGRMVNGSDLDIVIVTDDDCPEGLVRDLDQAIFTEKFRLLVDPDHREEIDYIIKDVSKVKRQLAFDSFRHMVACKILEEGIYLYGSRMLFEKIKSMVKEYGVADKIDRLTEKAIEFRRSAEAELIVAQEGLSEQECWKLFYTQAEQDEIF